MDDVLVLQALHKLDFTIQLDSNASRSKAPEAFAHLYHCVQFKNAIIRWFVCFQPAEKLHEAGTEQILESTVTELCLNSAVLQTQT